MNLFLGLRCPDGSVCETPRMGVKLPVPETRTERAMVTKIIFSRSGHSPKTVLLWKQESTRQRGLHDGAAWPCIGALHPCNCRQPPVTHKRLPA
jgi:hypothetical protein